jgi:hypothetical protein
MESVMIGGMRVPKWAAACGFVALSASAGMAQQPPAPATLYAVQPIAEPSVLVYRHTPSFRFVTVMRNFGPPLPGIPQQTVMEGGGTVIPDTRSTTWRLTVEKLAIDNQVYQASMPLALVTADTVASRPGARFKDVDLRGLASISYGAPPNAPAAVMLRRNLRAISAAMTPPQSAPIGPGSVVYDANPALYDFMYYRVPGAQIVKPLRPLVAQGIVFYMARPGILATVSDAATVLYASRYLTLTVDATAIFDLSSGLPLMVRLHLRGETDLPVYRGPVELVVVNVLALPGMRDPVPDAFAMAQPSLDAVPVAMGGLGIDPSRLAEPATPPKREPPRPAAAKPPAKPAAAPEPKAGEKPAAAPKPAPAGADVAGRLQQLKDLFDRGLITREQYEAKQLEILGKL